MIEQFPDSDLPYINLGNYYYVNGETQKAVQFFEKAVEKGTGAVTGQFLADYYGKQGDQAKAAYYLQKSKEAVNK